MERDGAEARVGITQYAADALGDVVFAELPEQGRQVMLYTLDDRPSKSHDVINHMQCLPNLVAFMAKHMSNKMYSDAHIGPRSAPGGQRRGGWSS